MRRVTVWGLLTFALALAVPAGAQATCTPSPTNPIVRMTTTLGVIDMQLDGTDAPCTVQNFEYYMDSGLYNGTFFHRSVSSPDVIQAGGYTLVDNKPQAIPTSGQPNNPLDSEVKDSNTADTIAMALTSSDDEPVTTSATDQWFINVDSNASSLDEYYTVFGKAIDPDSIAVINKIAAAQTCSLEVQWDDTEGVFGTVPTQGYAAGACDDSTGTPTAPPTAASASNLIFVDSMKILNDTTAPAITVTSPIQHETLNYGQKVTPSYSCNDGTGTGVESCTGPSTVDTDLYGTLQYTVTATDYAGNTDTKNVTYIVELPPTLQSVGTVSSKGVLGTTIHCPSSVACVGSVALTAGKPAAIIGYARFDIRPGGNGSVRVPLTSAGAKMFRAAKSRLKAALVIVPSGTGSKTYSSNITLKKPAAKPKPKKHKKKKQKKKKKK